MDNFDDLIPEMRNWNNGDGIDVQSWISCSGNFQLAIGYSTIFWPRFIEYEDLILFAGETPIEIIKESVDSFRKQGCDRKSLEAVMNHAHLRDFHYAGCPDATKEKLIYLGRILKEIYECKLKHQFPNKKFEVVFDDSDKDDLGDYQITKTILSVVTNFTQSHAPARSLLPQSSCWGSRNPDRCDRRGLSIRGQIFPWRPSRR